MLLTIEKMFLGKYLKKSRVLSRIYVLFLIVISFVIFNAASMGEAMQYIGGMFGIGATGFAGVEWLYNLRSFALIMAVAAVGATPVPKLVVKKLQETKYGKAATGILAPVFAVVIIVLCTAYLVDGSFNPFLYFRF